MKIAITGASGQIGRDLVLRLAGAGHELVLTGRDAARLRELFPGHIVFANEDFTEAFADADALIHLAVCNTDAAASPADHEAVNVEFALRVAEAARAVGLPTAMRRLLMTVLASLRPTTAADRALDAIVTAAETGTGPAFITDGQHGNRLYGGLRRAIDIVVAAGGLVLLAPLMLVIALLIRLGDGAPAILRQARVGQGQQPFTCYKFRTMAIGTPARLTHESSAVSVTPIGRILRPTKLDELPQLFNVLRGDVSLVGPRPCLPNQTELVAARAERGVFE